MCKRIKIPLILLKVDLAPPVYMREWPKSKNGLFHSLRSFQYCIVSDVPFIREGKISRLFLKTAPWATLFVIFD